MTVSVAQQFYLNKCMFSVGNRSAYGDLYLPTGSVRELHGGGSTFHLIQCRRVGLRRDVSLNVAEVLQMVI